MTTKAIGLIETVGFVTAIEVADAALKAANVKLLGYENARGGGRITIKVTGDVGAVKAAVSAGASAGEQIGRILSVLVIPRPHEEITGLIDQVERGPAPAATQATPALPAPSAKPAAPAKAATAKAVTTTSGKVAAEKPKARPSRPSSKRKPAANPVDSAMPAETPGAGAQGEEAPPAVEPEAPPSRPSVPGPEEPLSS